jgi:hypothetical protein
MARIVQKEAAMKFANSLAVLAGITVLLLVPTFARAADPQVRDDAGFFDAATIEKANAVIRQIKQDHGKDLSVETFGSIPPGLSAQYDPQRKDEFFDRWAAQRAADLKLDGVEVLICKDPARVQVQAGKNTIQRAFTQANLDRVRDILVGGFRSQNYNPALLSAVDYAKQSFDQNMGSARSGGGGPVAGQNSGRGAGGGASNSPAPIPPTSTRFSPGCFTWVLIIGGGLLLLSFIRRLFSGGGGSRSYGGAGYGGYGYGGGGGFGRGILGGLLGGMLGGYMQDRWSRGHTPPPDAGAGGTFGDSGSAFPSDQGQGFSGTGGDFDAGGGGGGGDFGGGGGGDAGGGSSGGDF